jgi:hypothetical protein
MGTNAILTFLVHRKGGEAKKKRNKYPEETLFFCLSGPTSYQVKAKNIKKRKEGLGPINQKKI